MFNSIIAKLKYYFNNIQNSAEDKILNNNSTAHLRPSNTWALGIGWSFLGVITFGTCWLFLAETDEIVIARGVLAPINDVVEIQVPTGGVIKDINIISGQKINKGDALFSLDDRSFRKKLASIDSQIKELLKIKQSRLKQIDLMTNTFTLKKKNLLEKIELQKSLLETVNNLSESGAVSEFQVFQQKESYNDVLIKYDVLINEESSQRLSIEQELNDIDYQLASKHSEYLDKQIDIEYKVVYSPISGTVFDVEPKAAGYVATGRIPLMKIVGDGSLQANIRIPAGDIGFVSVGMDAEVSVNTYPSSDFGVIEGKVDSLGTGAIAEDEVRGLGFYIPGSVSLDTQTLNSRSNKFPLRSGMTITANIKLRPVKYIELLLGTFSDKSKSLRRTGGQG